MKYKYMKYRIKWGLWVLAGCLFISCESEYSKTVKEELASGVIYDSIFLDMNFGDTRKQFFEKCWKMNKEGLITNGAKSPMVQYDFSDSTFHIENTKMQMLFYPLFDDKELINGMECEFAYAGWAPWNTHLVADSLLVKVNKIVTEWYGGNQFLDVKLADGQNLHTKVDGNRRIVSKILDDRYVSVIIHDLSHSEYTPKGL